MATFDDLPYETVRQIVCLLATPDLPSTALVSYRLHEITQPLLYNSLTLDWVHESICSRGHHSLQLILRTLLAPGQRSKTLGSHVRSLCVEWDNLELENIAIEPAITPPLPAGENAYSESQGAQLVLLLDRLPRLTILQFFPGKRHVPIHDPCAYYAPTITRFLDNDVQLGALPHGLRSLREFYYIFNGFTAKISSLTMNMLLKLPNIHNIEVPDISKTQLVLPIANHRPVPNTLTHLRFSHANLSVTMLSSILQDTIALTHFWYTSIHVSNLEIAAFMDALQVLRGSLQWLHLDLPSVRPNHSVPVNAEVVNRIKPNTSGSFRQWPVLRTLTCSFLPLLGEAWSGGTQRLKDVLPPGIRDLKIQRDMYWRVSEVVDQVVELLRCKQEAVPVLERIGVDLTFDENDAMIIRECEKAGVTFMDSKTRW